MKGEYISIETLRIMQDLEKENKELHKEIARLNKSLEEQRHFYLEKLQQKENIIKEVREYIENNTYKIEWGDLKQDNEDINISEDLTDKEFIENILEILDRSEK